MKNRQTMFCFPKKEKKQARPANDVVRSLNIYASVKLDEDIDNIDLNLFSDGSNQAQGVRYTSLAEEGGGTSERRDKSSEVQRRTSTRRYSARPTVFSRTLPSFAYKSNFSLEEEISNLRELDKEDNFAKVTKSYKYIGEFDNGDIGEDLHMDDIIINGYSSLDLDLVRRISTRHKERRILSEMSTDKTDSQTSKTVEPKINDIKTAETINKSTSNLPDVVQRPVANRWTTPIDEHEISTSLSLHETIHETDTDEVTHL